MAAEHPIPVEVPDDDYWRRQVKCQYACPVHTDARGYVRAVAAGDYESAYLIARGRIRWQASVGAFAERPARRLAGAAILTSRSRSER